MKQLILFIIPIMGSYMAFAQQNIYSSTGGDYQIEFGFDNSMGSQKQRIKKSVENEFMEIGYYSNKKYENPGIRLRLSKCLIEWTKHKIDLVSGLNLRIGEKYDDYAYVIKSVPIQMRFSTQLFEKVDSKLAFDFAGGVNVFNVTADYWRSKTGPLLTMGLSYNLSHKFYIKGGVELQYDKGSYFIFADPSLNIKDERIDYTEKRRQIFAALAIIL